MIFDSEGRILLCRRRDNGKWNLPGGHVEENEAPWEAATREALEEIGVTILIEKMTGVFFKREKNDLVFHFLAQITKGTPQTSNEVAEVAYFLPTELPTETAPYQRERIMRYIEDPHKVRAENQKNIV